MKRFAVGYEFLCRVIMMACVVHVAFIVHTVLGAVVGGLFPAVAASYATYRTWLLDVGDRSWSISRTWSVFHQAWKEELGSANALGWPMFLVWMLLVWDYYLVSWNDMGVIGLVASGVLVVVNIFYGLFMMVTWAIHVNFDERALWVIRMSAQMVIARPLCSLMIAALFVVTAWAYVTWPGLAVAFGVSVPVFAAMMAIYSFGRLPGMDVHILEPIEQRHR